VNKYLFATLAMTAALNQSYGTGLSFPVTRQELIDVGIGSINNKYGLWLAADALEDGIRKNYQEYQRHPVEWAKSAIPLCLAWRQLAHQSWLDSVNFHLGFAQRIVNGELLPIDLCSESRLRKSANFANKVQLSLSQMQPSYQEMFDELKQSFS
jgi:hypothetical protein